MYIDKHHEQRFSHFDRIPNIWIELSMENKSVDDFLNAKEENCFSPQS